MGGRKRVLKEDEDNDQGRTWAFCFYSEDAFARLRSIPHKGLVCAREVATGSKMEHYQGAVIFENPKQKSWWHNQFYGYTESLDKIGEDGTPVRYWNWWGISHSPKMARLYVVDCARWMRITKGQANWHEKTQGEILVDEGFPVYTADKRHLDIEAQVIDMILDGAEPWQVVRQFPRTYYRRRRLIQDLCGDVKAWKEMGVDYHPGCSSAIKEPLSKRFKKDYGGPDDSP